MKKLYLITLLFLQITNCKPLEKKPWLFFTHIAAVNNLYPFAAYDLNEMQQGTNKNVNTLAFFHGLPNTNQRFTQKIVLSNNKIISEKKLNIALDSGKSSTLIAGAKWAIVQAPHDYIVINLWNHGSGILNPITRGVCFDDISSNYLTDKDLLNSLEQITKLRNGKKVDILGFDACLMGSIENFVTCADSTKFIVASEETIPGYGWGYKTVLNSLNPNSLPRDFAISMVDSYKKTYNNVEADYTMAAIDSSKIKAVATNLNNVAQVLTKIINKNASFKLAIQKSLNKTVKYYEPFYIDLGDFYKNLLNDLNLINAKKSDDLLNSLIVLITNGRKLIKQAVLKSVAGPSKKNSTGISVYFPTDLVDPSYSNLYWSKQYPNWLNFLKKYLY